MRQTSSKDKIQTSIFTFSERSLWMRPNNLEKNFNIHFLNICRTELLHAQLIHFSSSSAFMEFYVVRLQTEIVMPNFQKYYQAAFLINY